MKNGTYKYKNGTYNKTENENGNNGYKNGTYSKQRIYPKKHYVNSEMNNVDKNKKHVNTVFSDMEKDHNCVNMEINSMYKHVTKMSSDMERDHNWSQQHNKYEVLANMKRMDTYNMTEKTDNNIPSAEAPKGILKDARNTETEETSRTAKKVRFKNNKNKVRKKGKNKLTNLKLIFANANGIKDKISSVQAVAEEYGAHLVAIAETKQIPPKLEGYGKWKSKERTDRAGGGGSNNC